MFLHLGFDAAIVVGHNWGNHVGFHLARTRPNLVKALVSLSSGYYPEPLQPEKLVDQFPQIGYQVRNSSALAWG